MILWRHSATSHVLPAIVVLAAGLSVAWADAPPPSSPEQRIQALIRQLGDPDYAVRQRAQDELAQFGFEAFEALTAATEHEDLEIAARAKYLLRLIRVEWSRPGDPEEVRTLLDDYEGQAPDERFKRIQRLARLPDHRGTAALCRLIRYEPSPLLSKLAGMELLDRTPADPAERSRWAQMLQEHLGSSARPAAKWLTTYCRLRAQPEAATAEWVALVEAEQAALRRTPEQSSVQIVAVLWYRLATVQWERGQQELARKTAGRARQLSPGKEDAQVLLHLEVASALRRRGMTRWAEEEYRYVIASGSGDLAAIAQVYLAEMLHDQGDNLGAAAAMEALSKMLAEKKVPNADILGRSAQEIQARMYYFHACHCEQQGDRPKQRHWLEEALKAFPAEVDVLIACYHLPDQTPAFRENLRSLIAKAAAGMRQEIMANPDEGNAYNQFAWLIGNTEGDFDEALRCAQKAVELEPDSGAFYDTLAHVYAGRGDYANAVKYQSRAVELDPHSGLIARKLKLFQEKLKEQKRG